MTLSFIKTDASNSDFTTLVALLDKDLAQRDGVEDHAFYAQFNKIGDYKYAMVVYDNNAAIACGAVKPFDKHSMEVKRMYVPPVHRGKGIASLLLLRLENWAQELGYQNCVLETGKKQPEAIALYKKNGYQVTDNYGQYIGIENSVCFKKVLNKG